MIKERLWICFVLVMLLLVLVLPSDVSIGEPVYSVTPYSLSKTEATTLLKTNMLCFIWGRRGGGSGPAPSPTIEAAANLAWNRYSNDPIYEEGATWLFGVGGGASMRYNVTGAGGYFAGISYYRALSGYDTSKIIPEGFIVTRAYLALSQWVYRYNDGPIVVEASNNPPPYTVQELFAYSGNFAGENTTAKAGGADDILYIELNPVLINTEGTTYFLLKSQNDGEDIIPRYVGEVGFLSEWKQYEGLALYLEVHPFCIDGVFQPVQVVWQNDSQYGNNMTNNGFGDWTAGIPMVQGKNTLLFGSSYPLSNTIRFTVTNNYGSDKNFTLRFRVMPDSTVIYESAVFRAPPGQTIINIPAPIPYSDVLKTLIPFQFKNEGPATIEVEVVPAAGSEPIDSNKVVVHVTVKHTKSLSILYIGIRLPWDSIPTVNMGRATDFILGTYPIAESDITNYTLGPETQLRVASQDVQMLHNNGQLNTKPWNETILAGILNYYSRYVWFGQRWDRVVLVVPNGWQTNFGSGSWTGLSIPSATPGAFFVVQDCLTTVAHEIGHTYNLPVTQNSPGEEYNIGLNIIGNFAHGYWVNERVERGPGTYCFMSARTHLPQSLDRWICTLDYKYLISREFSLTADPEVLGVSGLIFKNNSVVFDPCYRIPQALPDLEAGETGNYSVVLLNNAGTVLSRIGFNATFMIEMGETMPMSETDVVPFAFKIPWMTNTSRIEIRDATDNVLATRIASANSPSVTVTFPNGGEILTPPQNYTITWNASDPDGNPLTYAVLYSDDNGTSWLPLAIDYKETSYVWNVTGLPRGSNHLVKIIATDGVNTGEDVSDYTFTIAGHNVAISNVLPSKTVVGQGYSLNINVTAANQGDYTETFNVTAYADALPIPYTDVFYDPFDVWNYTGAWRYSDPDAAEGYVSVSDGMLHVSGWYGPSYHDGGLTTIKEFNYPITVETKLRPNSDWLSPSLSFGQHSGQPGWIGISYDGHVGGWHTCYTDTTGHYHAFWGDSISVGTWYTLKLVVNETNFKVYLGDVLKVDRDWLPPQEHPKTISLRSTYGSYGSGDFDWVKIGTEIETKTLTLPSGNSTTITFTWNTTGFAKGNYTISAYAWPVLGETDTADNNLTDGTILITIPGDINGDRKVDLVDVYAVGRAFGSVYNSTDGWYWHTPRKSCCRHNPNCDINWDGKIDLKDYFTTCKNYGKEW
jgi:hypothetical protein